VIYLAVSLCALAPFLLVVGLVRLLARSDDSETGRSRSLRRRLDGRGGGRAAAKPGTLASLSSLDEPGAVGATGTAPGESAERPQLSSIGLLRSLLELTPLSRRIECILRGAGIGCNVGTFVLLVATSAFSAGVLTWCALDTVIVGALAGVVAGILPVGWVLFRRRRRLLAFERHFPDALDMMVNALRSGAGLASALGVVAAEAASPINAEFTALLQQQKLGVDLRQGLTDLQHRMDLVEVHLFSTALIVQKETGGNLAEVLEKIAAVVRDRFQILGDARSLTAEGRLSGLILALLPVALATAIFFMTPDYVRFFVDHPAGRLMIGAAVLLELTGFLLIRKISNVRF
jgi:tight adherence protein B